MHESERSGITEILGRISRGEQEAVEELVPLVYEKLRQLARARMRQENPGHTLETTALAHDAYMRLVGGQELQWADRAHFFRAAVRAMRQILVDHARERNAKKRGGDWNPVPLDASGILDPGQPVDAVVIAEELQVLRSLNERHAEIIELRFYCGLTVAEIAEILGVSRRTVRRDLHGARAWLRMRLSAGGAR